MNRIASLPVVGCLLLSGCLSTGPISIRTQSGAYNRSVVSTGNKQMLLNLVRLRYRDIPYFLEVSSITAGGGTQVDVGASFDALDMGFFNLEQKDSPTISYTPLKGTDFLKQVLIPIPPESLLVMMQSGWSAQRVMGICVEKINDLDNATVASGPTPSDVPDFREFQHMSELLRTLQKAGLLDAGADEDGNVILKIMESPHYADELAEFRSLIGAAGNASEYKLTTNFLNVGAGEIAMRTRSISSVLFFLSQNIEIPREHLEKGLVTITADSVGNEFNWDELTGAFFKVYSSKTPPADAYVSVLYRGSWFYVKDADLNSKSTFMLLTQLFNLQAGQIQSTAPTLTIPVGAG